MDAITKNLKLVNKNDEYDNLLYCQELYDTDTGEEIFKVYNLTHCPEDAIIERSLFNAYDYVKALNKGIALAKAGYDEVVFSEEFEEER